MTPYLRDADCTLYHGDVLAVLPELEAESVDCVVTSPPYWGLRDYGTGAWAGGDEGCDHTPWVPTQPDDPQIRSSTLEGGKQIITTGSLANRAYKSECGKCGATRIDQQLGLEPTPEEYVTRLVEVFREVRRVLAAHGTVWLNLGDSYAHGAPSGTAGQWNGSSPLGENRNAEASTAGQQAQGSTAVSGLKPKDLCGIPWRVAFALQADGWYLRSDIIWAKPNPMPESVTDRPTKAHEYVFLLSKQPRYFFDQEAVREAHSDKTWFYRDVMPTKAAAQTPELNHNGTGRSTLGTEAAQHPAGRNIRSVWEIATQPYPDAHFATFPEELARRCIAAGCPEQVCRVCGKARERIVETDNPSLQAADDKTLGWANTHSKTSNAQSSKSLHRNPGGVYSSAVVKGWTDCGHSDYRCGDCGMVINSCDYADSKVTVPELHGDPGSDGETGSSETLLLAEVRERMDSETPSEHEGLLHRREGLSADQEAGPSAGVEERLRDGASAGDGTGAGTTAQTGRGGASQERQQVGQPGEEPGSDAEAPARSQAEATAQADHLPSLRGDDHRLGPCPSCDGRLERVPDHERFRPGVTLDPFIGSGTVAHVARKLGRHSIGIELNQAYAELAAKRLQQQSLFAEV